MLNSLKVFLNQPVFLKKRDTEKVREYIFENSVKSMGIVSVVDSIGIDCKGKEFVFYYVDFKRANGISDVINEDNKKKLIHLLNNFPYPLRFSFPERQKNLLNESIAFYEKCLKELESNGASESKIRVLKNRLYIMKVFNQEKYNSLLFMIPFEAENNFVQIGDDFLNLEKLDTEQIKEFIEGVNNEF